MKVTVSKSLLLKTLEDLSPGLSNRELSEQTNCFVFQNGKIFTYNDEICCRVKSPIDMEITGAIMAGKLLAVLRKLDDDELAVSVEDGMFKLKGKGRVIAIRMQAEVLLNMDAVEQPDKWARLPEDFMEAVSMVEKCAGTDQQKFARTCIHLTPDFMEAYDGFQIARYTLQLKAIKESLLVRRDSLKAITRLGVVGYTVGKNWMHFTDKTMTVSMRMYTESFGDLSKHLNIGGDAVVFPKGLIDALDKSNVFSSENPDQNTVLVDLRADRVSVKGEGTSGYYVEQKRVKYSGQEIAFFITPDLLTQLIEKHSECEVSNTTLRASIGSFVYVVSLEKV